MRSDMVGARKQLKNRKRFFLQIKSGKEEGDNKTKNKTKNKKTNRPRFFTHKRKAFSKMVCGHLSIRINKVTLVVNNIVLETLDSNTIVNTPHVAPNFCSRPDPLYDKKY